MYLTRRQALSLFSTLPLVSSCLAGCTNMGGTPPTLSMKLNVGTVSATSVNNFAFYVAAHNGYFKDEGLQITSLAVTATPPKNITLLEQGVLDASNGAVTDFYDMSIIDGDARIAGALVNGYFNDIIVSHQLAAETGVTITSTLAEKTKALVGKNIGIISQGSASDALLIYLFYKELGLSAYQDAHLVSLGAVPSTVIPYLTTGKVDALSMSIPVAEIIGAGGVNLISPVRGDVPALQGTLLGTLIAKQSVLNYKARAMQAYIRVLARGQSFIHSHPAEALPVMQAYMKLKTKDVATLVQNVLTPVVPMTPQVSLSSYDIAARFHVASQLITAAPAFERVVAVDTITAALKGLK